MLYESHVIGAVCSFLEQKGFRITQRLLATQRGEDIKGFSPDGKTKISIEARGETSSVSSSARYGKAFDSGQVLDHVSKAVYKAALHFSTETMAGVAFPKNPAHLDCVNRILPALKRLDIEVFWVRPEGGVETEQHCRVWARSEAKAGSKAWKRYSGIFEGSPDLSSRKGYPRG